MNTRLAVAAAIEGHSPAGGCMLALTADERVMAKGKLSIGLNETRLGIVAPIWFIDSFRAVVGQRQSERLLQLGEMVTSAEALNLGLVDQVVPAEEVRETAVTALERYLQVPAAARHMTKVATREDIVARLAKNLEADLQGFVDLISQPAIQKGLGKYLESLSARAKQQ
jgi:3,2-trans-enoyl-CoA isomerase